MNDMGNAFEFQVPQEDPFAFIQDYRHLKGNKVEHLKNTKLMGSTQMFGVPTVIDLFIEKADEYIAAPELDTLLGKWKEDDITDGEFATLSGYFLEYCRKSGKPLHDSNDAVFIVEQAA